MYAWDHRESFVERNFLAVSNKRKHNARFIVVHIAECQTEHTAYLISQTMEWPS